MRRLERSDACRWGRLQAFRGDRGTGVPERNLETSAFGVSVRLVCWKSLASLCFGCRAASAGTLGGVQARDSALGKVTSWTGGRILCFPQNVEKLFSPHRRNAG